MAVTPHTTQGAPGGVLANAALAASGVTSGTCNINTLYGATVQIHWTGGSAVSATNGLRVDIFCIVTTAPHTDTIPYDGCILPVTVSHDDYFSFKLPIGDYKVQLTNLDATNGLAGVDISMDTISDIS